MKENERIEVKEKAGNGDSEDNRHPVIGVLRFFSRYIGFRPILNAVWILGLPYLEVWLIIEWGSYWRLSDNDLKKLSDKEIKKILNRRMNMAFFVFTGILVFVYLTFRGIFLNSLYDILSISIGALLLAGGYVCKEFQFAVCIEETKELKIDNSREGYLEDGEKDV